MTSSLTREAVLAEPAGPRLDAWVAEHVMGIKPPFGYSAPPADGFWSHERSRLLPTVEDAVAAYVERGLEPDHHDYLCYWKEGWGPLMVSEWSRHISDAWLVWEKLQEQHFSLVLTCEGNGEGGKDFRVGSSPPCDSVSCLELVLHDDEWVEPQAELTAELAICRAALLSVLPPPGTPVGSASAEEEDDHDDDDQRFG